MTRRSIFRMGLTLPLLGLTACTASTTTSDDGATAPPPRKVEVGAAAPELAGRDMDGKPVSLHDYRGKVVLLDFWATWCGPCVREIPHEKALAKKFDGRPFVILGVSADRRREDLKKFLDKEKLPWPNVYDERLKIAERWDVEAFPTFVLVDAKGFVAGQWVGGGQSNDIEAAVERAVKEAERN